MYSITKTTRFLFGISIALLSFVSLSANAQTATIAQWKEALPSLTTTVEKADCNFRLAQALYSYHLEEGFSYAKQSLQLAQKAAYHKGIAQALTALGDYYFFEGDFTASAKHYRQALSAAYGQKLKEYPATTFLQLSRLHRTMASFDSAQYYLDQASALIPAGRNSVLLASLWKNKGLLANAHSHNDAAIAFLNRAATISRTVDDNVNLSDTWRILGTVYKDMSSYDTSFIYYDRAEKLARRIQEPVILMLISLNRGETNFSVGAFEQAIENYTTALNLLKDHTYKLYYGIALFKIGEVYENEGAYHTAFEYFYNSLKEHERLGARQEIERTYSQIGWCYAYQENYAKAQENAQRSLNIAREIRDSSSIGQNQNLLGYILYKTEKYQAARRSFEQAIAIRKKIKDWYGYSFSLFNSGLTFIELEQPQKAKELFLESIEVDQRIGKKVGILFTSNALGRQYAREKNFERATYYLTQANKLATEIPVPTQLLINYNNYIFLYEAQRKNEKVIAYYKRYTQLNDSLNNAINSTRIAKADALFQLQKKANEIQLINRENDLHQDLIQIQRREISFQRSVIFLSVLSILILGAVVILIYFLFRSNKKSKEKLRIQNASILDQQEKIQAQSEELKASNKQLSSLNAALSEKHEEIEVQSAKLKAAYEDLEYINDSLEKRVEERTSELNKAYHELETFFYHTSHDFKRPLTTYHGLVEIGRATVADEQVLQLFDKVKETTQGLDNMLLKLQSISNVNYHEIKRNIHLHTMLHTCVDKFTKEIAQRKMKLSIQCTAIELYSNPFLLNVVMENLIENAIHFCHDTEPFLSIKAQRTGSQVEIVFEDNGQGIDDRLKPRIFEMYFRANVTSKGNGLGLYISRRAVEKMGGALTFTSTLHQGSCFTAKIPLHTS